MTCGMEHGHCCVHGYHEHGHHGHGGMKKHHCPVCGEAHEGMGGHGAMMGEMGSQILVKKATKKLLLEKIEARLDERWGGKLDAIAQEMVDIAEEKMKTKKEMWKRKQEMKHRLYEMLTEEEED